MAESKAGESVMDQIPESECDSKCHLTTSFLSLGGLQHFLFIVFNPKALNFL